MSQNLVIVESPAKAKTITKYLGRKYKVLASVGHIKDLPVSKLGVDIENDFEPTYVVMKGKANVLKQIKDEAKKAEAIYLAPDPDREGEAIAWHIAEEVGKSSKNKINVRRVLFEEITKDAVTTAIKNPVELRPALFEAQQARRILDRLVGYKISPILWKKVRRGLSAGRVQSVAVRLVCEREALIEAFVSEEYWSIVTKLSGDIPPEFEAKLVKIDGKDFEIHDEKTASQVQNEIRNQKLILTKVVKKERKRNPSPPFITSKLQQEAARKLGFTAKKTMMLAQKLYEGVDLGDGERVGLITYMRTDSPRIANQAMDAVREYIKIQYGVKNLPDEPHHFKARKSAQEAHECIRPTSMERTPESMSDILEKDEMRLYDLIWKRFVASQMIPAVFDQTSFDITADKYLLRATGSVMKDAGFINIYIEGEDDVKEKDEEENPNLPDLKEGSKLKLLNITPNQHFTQPPPRFTEASLVKELEEKGIGRPSTYASILSVIQTKKYVEKIDKQFHPTILGKTVNELLVKHFPKILDVAFTAKMEDDLDGVEEGELKWLDILKNFYATFENTLKKAESEMENIKAQSIKTSLHCPDCGAELSIKWGRHGEFLACTRYPACKHTSEFKREESGLIVPIAREERKTDEICDKCKSPMVVKRGRFGEFLACSKYPECKFTKSISIGIKCPLCETGDVIQRKSKRGRMFFGCNNYPKCKFVSWDMPVHEKCERCGNPYMVERVRKTGSEIVCPECTKRNKENRPKTKKKKDADE